MTREAEAIHTTDHEAQAHQGRATELGQLQPGDQLDSFRIESVVGQGAFSTMYLARPITGGDRVVIKVLHAGIMGDPNTFDRFRREMAITKRLSHPNIQRSLDVGGDRSQPYIVLEYVEGDNFRHYLKAHAPLPAQEAVGYALQILSGLEHMHAQGIVHRDLKPENLLRTPDGQIKIIDFGVAFMQGARRLTWRWLNDGLGTPDYMAPEQIQGKRGDHRADIYALGIILYEMLSGRTPWSGDNPLAVMSQQLSTTPTELHRLNRSVPPPLEAIVRKMVRKDPRERYQSVAELRNDLTHWEDLDLTRFIFADEQPLSAARQGPFRIWVLFVLVGGAFILGSGIAVYVTYLLVHH